MNIEWRHFIIINLLCIFVVGYFSYHIGLASGKQICIKEYFAKPIQDEIKFVLETSQLLQCESGNRFNVYGDGGKAYGGFQFWEATFYGFAKEAGMEDLKLDWKNVEHQFRVYKWAYYNGKLSSWTCYKPIDF